MTAFGIFDLADGQLRTAREELLRLFPGCRAIGLLDVQVSEDQAVVIQAIESLYGDPGEVASSAFTLLSEITTHGGLLDPKSYCSDVPWVWFLRELEPAVASKYSRSLYVLLDRARHRDEPVAPSFAAMAAYGVALAERRRGRDGEARFWMRIGANEVDHEEEPGLAGAVMIRAVVLLGRGTAG